MPRSGIGRGDSVVLMLGNQVELWESMLAVIKLGAVVMPTTTAVGPGDLVDRMERGAARAVITNASEVHKFDDVPGDYVRIAVGGADPAGTVTDGWESHEAAYAMEVGPTEHPGTAPDDRMLLYFTSGTTSRPKLVEHTQRSYPVGHLSTMYWIGLQPGDVHLNISSPGWAKHAWSSFFAPWAAEATVVRLQLQPVRPGRAAPRAAHARGHLDLRAADRVADAHQQRPLRRVRARCARSSAPASRSTPRSSPRSRRRGA